MEVLTQLSADMPLIDAIHTITFGDFLELLCSVFGQFIAVLLFAFLLGAFSWAILCSIKESIEYLFDRYRMKKGMPLRRVDHFVAYGDDINLTSYVRTASDADKGDNAE